MNASGARMSALLARTVDDAGLGEDRLDPLADALLAGRLGVRPAYVLSESSLNGKGLAAALRLAAARLDMRPAGLAPWDRDPPSSPRITVRRPATSNARELPSDDVPRVPRTAARCPVSRDRL
jgi:hypothetical protein